MSVVISDGSGTGYKAAVDSTNHLSVRAITQNENQDAVVDGRAWNFNTGWIDSISSDSALMYFRNQDEEDFFVDSIAVGLKESLASEVQGLYLISQPTSGTLIDAATDCDMIENRRIGSGEALDVQTLIYKSTTNGQTLVGGRDSALFAQNDGGRLFASVDFVVPKGQAIGIRVEVLGGFNDSMYAAIIGHKRKV